MGISNEIPFLPEGLGVTTLETGWAVGQEFVDPRTGNHYRLFQVATDLNNDALADGEPCAFSNHLSGIITNKAANYESTTYPKVAGIACGAVPESSATTTRYCLLLVKAHTKSVLTDGGGDIAKFDIVALDETTNGRADRIDHTQTVGTLKWGTLFHCMIGVAQADDSATAVTCSVDIAR